MKRAARLVEPTRDEEEKDNDVGTSIGQDPDLRTLVILLPQLFGATTMLERWAMKRRVWPAMEERQRVLLLCFYREIEVVQSSAIASQNRSRQAMTLRATMIP
ncbi:hypothetical protein GW17_00041856 [Ensete ventricosum]|nr:hypothetical protein GW17_00041856 [Ensete ventricosum]RZS01433.1 hypothetical protein BHM03_00031305 [Ensete ventricosum]